MLTLSSEYHNLPRLNTLRYLEETEKCNIRVADLHSNQKWNIAKQNRAKS